MEIIEYAKQELALIGHEDDPMQKAINDNIMEIVEVFANQGHSGFSANYAINVIERLLRFKPIVPLTGEENEWVKVDTGVFQNKRCSSVFKRDDGTAPYDLGAVIVSDNGGLSWFHSKDFDIPISFPYVPPISPEQIYIECVEGPSEKHPDGLFRVITNQPDRIKALYDRALEKIDGIDGSQ